jgi:hypothetical protein
MSVLPGGQRLHRVLPDLDELLENPHDYLSEAPLAFASRRMYGLALLFALPGIAFLISCIVSPPNLARGDAERLALGIGFLIGSCIWLGWSLMLRGHELVMHPDGIEVTFRDSTVWAPWALFQVEGQPFVPESDSPRAGLTLPVNPKAIPYVELRRAGMVVARGLLVQGRQWFFVGRSEVTLPGRYEIAAEDVGELLLWLGGQLGKELPRQPAPAEAELDERFDLPDADPEGWITVPLTRLRLPSCCTACGGPRDDTLRVQVHARGDWLLGPLFGVRTAEVAVPICVECREKMVREQRRGGLLGLVLGSFLGAVVGVALGGWLGEMRQVPLMLGMFAGLFVGTFVGSLIGVSLSRRLPIRFRRYLPSRGVVSVRFTNPAIAAHVIEQIREQARR